MGTYQFSTSAARLLYMGFLNYMFMADDPKFSTLRNYANKIRKAQVPKQDQLELVRAFEEEVKESINNFQ
jgi:CDP-glycerol glycerophosphotransferase (TagB/SpsB family)